MRIFEKKITVIASLFIALGIIFGALGAHALEKVLLPEKLATFEVGVKYQIYQGIALLALISLQDKFKFETKVVFRLLVIGTILFSGSIYVLVFQELLGLKLGTVFGPITPIGGLLMILGWVILVYKLVTVESEK